MTRGVSQDLGSTQGGDPNKSPSHCWYQALGFRKGYWKRLYSVLTNYVETKMTINQLMKAISEEPRARGEVLTALIHTITLKHWGQKQLNRVKEAVEQCIHMGYIEDVDT